MATFGREKDVCPHCDKERCVPEVVGRSVERHGTDVFDVRCRWCAEMIRVRVVRTSYLNSIEKSGREYSDFDF